MTNNVTIQKKTKKRQIFSNTSFVVPFPYARDRTARQISACLSFVAPSVLFCEISRSCLALEKKDSDEIIDKIFGSRSGLAATAASCCLSATLSGHRIILTYGLKFINASFKHFFTFSFILILFMIMSGLQPI